MTSASSSHGVGPFPAGTEFLSLVSKAETACVAKTEEEIPDLGISAPASYAALGNVLSLLSAEAACSYGCAGGDHFWQKLTARVVTHSLGSLRLAMSGYYDEALSLARGVGEIANLLFLFAAKPEQAKFWQTADEKHRKRHFGPAAVRRAIESLGYEPPIDESRYGLLCEIGVHLVPSVQPQAFTQFERPTLGASFRDGELMVALNELSFVVAQAAGCVSALEFVGARATSLRLEAEVLLNMVGNLNLQAAQELARNGA